MKRLLMFSLLLTCSVTKAQSFRRTFRWGNFNTFPSFAVSTESGYGIFGSYSGPSTAQTGLVFFRTDSDGALLWEKTFGGGGVDQARDIIALPDSGWLLAGYTNSFSSNNDYDGYLLRLDRNGDTLWTHTYGGTDWDFLHDALLLPDGNYLLCGSSQRPGSGSVAGWMLVVDPSGTLVQEQFYQVSENSTLLKATLCTDGDLLFAGFTENPNDFHRKALVIRRTYPVLQNQEWSYSTTNLDREEIHDVEELPSGEILVCGSKTYSGRTDLDFLIQKISGNGFLVNQDFTSDPGDSGYNDFFVSNDTVYACGYISSSGQGGNDFVVNLFTTSLVFANRSCTLGKGQDEVIEHAEKDSGNFFLLGGTTTSEPQGIQSMLFVKTDISSCSQTTPWVIGIKENELPYKPEVFPNPTDGIFQVRLPDGWTYGTELKLSVISTTGEIIFEESIYGERVTVHLSGYTAGVYRLVIQRKDGQRIGRNIVLLSAAH
jgi:hypothetical protein